MKDIRRSHYFINYFNLKRCFELKNILAASSSSTTSNAVSSLSSSVHSPSALNDLDHAAVESRDNISRLLTKYVCFVNPEIAANPSDMAKLVQRDGVS